MRFNYWLLLDQGEQGVYSSHTPIGFEELSLVFDKSSKSFMRMFGPKGNPQASRLFALIHNPQEQEGVHLEVQARKVA